MQLLICWWISLVFYFLSICTFCFLFICFPFLPLDYWKFFLRVSFGLFTVFLSIHQYIIFGDCSRYYSIHILTVTIYMCHNLHVSQSTRIDILLLWVKCRKLTSLLVLLPGQLLKYNFLIFFLRTLSSHHVVL